MSFTSPGRPDVSVDTAFGSPLVQILLIFRFKLISQMQD